MRKLIVSEFISLDGVIQAPGGAEEDTEGGFKHGGWTMPYWHDDIGAAFGAMMQDTDAFLLGRKTYVVHGNVVSKTLENPVWRNTTIIRENVVEAVKALKAAPGKNILTDGSHQLVHTLLEHDLVDGLHLLLYPLLLGGGKRLFPNGVHTGFKLTSAKPYPSGVVGLHYERVRTA
jgi:dihydrofolate reductase